MKKISIIFLLAIVITFGLCVAIENTAGNNFQTKTTMDAGKNKAGNFHHDLFAISKAHTVMGDVSAILQKTFQETFIPQILTIVSLILIFVKLFKKRTKDNLSPPILTSILISHREYYRKLSWSTPPAPKTFLKLNPRIYA